MGSTLLLARHGAEGESAQAKSAGLARTELPDRGRPAALHRVDERVLTRSQASPLPHRWQPGRAAFAASDASA